jgi:hypothetical protein
MSYISSDYIQCETIQSMIEDEFVTCPTPYEAMPFFEAVVAGQSAAKISQTVSDGDGKVKNVKVVYDNRLLESAATEGSGARSCTTTNETFNNFTNYTIDPSVFVTAGEKFETANLNSVCTHDVRSMLAAKIRKVMDVIERKVATKTSNEAVALYGKWATTVANVISDELVVSTLITPATSKQIDYSAMSDIDMALMQTGYCGPKIIVGGPTLYKYGQHIEKGCCSTTGVNILDMANAFGKAFLYDERITTALGSNDKALVFQLGSLVLLKYNEAPQLANLGANYAKMLMFSPRTGLPIDIVLKDDCGTISVVGYANTKLVALPSDLYALGDKFRGVNYVNKIKVVNT